ncbi:hypothetical protein AB0C86_28470 [Streptomyces lavendulae]|uniref:hypothetical protein n=1 Tax=Streptomyces lavendulae TaxID=1914 RepID=UPI0033F34F91
MAELVGVGRLPGEAGSPVLAPAAVCPPGDGPPPPLFRYQELRNLNLEPGHPA